VVQPDGRILAAGMFVTINNLSRPKIVRLNANGSVDPTFAGPPVQGISFGGPSPYDSHFAAMALQPDGKIVVGGTFTNIGGKTAHNVARYNADGSIDPSFASTLMVNEAVNAVALQPDGRILIAGGYWDNFISDDRGFVYRLLPNGDLDPDFTHAASDGTVTSMILLPGGDIAIGGQFSSVNGIPALAVARLNGDGMYLRAGGAGPGVIRMDLFNTLPGSTNVLEGAADLLNWLPVQTNVASGASQQWNMPATGSYRYYRVKNVGP